MLIVRDAYELAELADGWGLSEAEIRYLVAEEKLKLSVRLVAQPTRRAREEIGSDGTRGWSAGADGVFNGLADLGLRDAFRLVRDGEALVREVFLPGPERLMLRDGEGLRLSQVDALVRAEQVAVLEQEIVGRSVPEAQPAFDFRQFVLNDREYAFTFTQARALAFLFERAREGVPDQHYLDILKAAGSASQRLSSLFSRKPLWKTLVLKTAGRRGWYYLEPRFVVWLTQLD